MAIENQTGDEMVAITLPTALLDALIEILSAAKAKAAQDIQANEVEVPADDPSGLAEELSGSGRQQMETIVR